MVLPLVLWTLMEAGSTAFWVAFNASFMWTSLDYGSTVILFP